MQVRLTRQAIADVDRAAAYYEGQSEGLGEKFLQRVEEAIAHIEIAPEGYAPVIKDVRRCNLAKFPYGLFYRIQEDAVVIGCLDSRRDPIRAKHRALGILEMPDPQG
jgi:plasmid stabilization system protein ParE